MGSRHAQFIMWWGLAGVHILSLHHFWGPSMTIGEGSATRVMFSSRRLSGLAPAAVGRVLDAILAALLLVLVAGWVDPELILDALWVTLASGAFVVGLRGTIVRILLCTVVVFGAWAIEGMLTGQMGESDVIDGEWALMAALTIIIAVLASRVSSTAQRYAALYRQASDSLVTAHEDERARLARDLHDGVGQTLTSVVLTLDAAAQTLVVGRDMESGMSKIHRARALAQTALDEAHDVAAQLRPSRISELGLGAAISELAESSGLQVDLWFDPSILPAGLVDPGREIDAYRIIQEALSNVSRHSHATRVWIDAEVSDGAIRIQVGDNGVGFSGQRTSTGMGLPGMEERAAIVQGAVAVRSETGVGTTVDLTMPISPPPSTHGVPDTTVKPAPRRRSSLFGLRS